MYDIKINLSKSENETQARCCSNKIMREHKKYSDILATTVPVKFNYRKIKSVIKCQETISKMLGGSYSKMGDTFESPLAKGSMLTTFAKFSDKAHALDFANLAINGKYQTNKLFTQYTTRLTAHALQRLIQRSPELFLGAKTHIDIMNILCRLCSPMAILNETWVGNVKDEKKDSYSLVRNKSGEVVGALVTHCAAIGVKIPADFEIEGVTVLKTYMTVTELQSSASSDIFTKIMNQNK